MGKIGKKNYIILGIFVAIIGIILFFMISPTLFKSNEEELLYSQLNKEARISMDSGQIGTLKISNWTYSPSQDLMEVQLYIDMDVKYTNSTQFDFVAKKTEKENSKKVDRLDSSLVMQEGNYYVVQISNVKDFTVVSLWVEITVDKDKVINTNSINNSDVASSSVSSSVSEGNAGDTLEENTDNSSSTTSDNEPIILKLRTNYKQVTQVDEIADKDSGSYAIDRLNISIDELNAKIQRLQDNIVAYQTSNKSIDDKIKQYQNDLKYAAEDEKTSINQKIEKCNSDTEDNLKEIDEANELINKYNEQIDELKKKIDEIKP